MCISKEYGHILEWGEEEGSFQTKLLRDSDTQCYHLQLKISSQVSYRAVVLEVSVFYSLGYWS